MGAQKEQESIPQARWFEEKITQLYSRNLFLRQEEKHALLESARLIDKFAARQFAIDTHSDANTHRLDPALLQNLIANLRKRQTKRAPDAARLAQFREQAIAFRKNQMNKGKLSQWLDVFRGSGLKLRLENLERESLRLDMSRTEMRHRVALRLLTLMVCDAYMRECKTHADQNVENVIKLLRLRADLKRKKRFYQKLLTEVRSEKVIEGHRG